MQCLRCKGKGFVRICIDLGVYRHGHCPKCKGEGTVEKEKKLKN